MLPAGSRHSAGYLTNTYTRPGYPTPGAHDERTLSSGRAGRRPRQPPPRLATLSLPTMLDSARWRPLIRQGPRTPARCQRPSWHDPRVRALTNARRSRGLGPGPGRL